VLLSVYHRFQYIVNFCVVQTLISINYEMNSMINCTVINHAFDSRNRLSISYNYASLL